MRQPVFVPLPVTRAGHLLLAVLTLAAAACFLLRKRLPAANLLLALVLAALLPMGMNLSNFLGYAGMEAHDLMKYAFCLVYVFDILLLRQCLQSLPESRVFSGCAAISLCADRRARLGKYPDGKRALSQKKTLSGRPRFPA